MVVVVVCVSTTVKILSHSPPTVVDHIVTVVIAYQLTVDHYNAVSTFHDDNICEPCFLMLCTGSLELTTENCSQ